MWITRVYDDALKISWPLSRPSGTTSGELTPVEAEVHDKQRGKSEGDDTDGGEGVAEMAPVTGPEVEHTAGDEGKGNGIGAGHPLAVLCDLAVACGDEGGGSADHPGGGLHGSSGKTRAPGCESDPREGTNKHGNDVDAAEDAMELEVTLADSRGEIDGADQKSEDSGECMRDEEMAVGNDLQTVGVVHRIVSDEENF
jgi:hypothetical protein